MKSIRYTIALFGLLFCLNSVQAQGLYAISQSTTTSLNYLSTVNPLTGSVTIISAAPLSKFVITGMSTLDPIHQRFYYTGPKDTLYMVNLANGSLITKQKLSTAGSYFVSLIEFNRRDSLLYAIINPTVSNAGTFLAKINPFTGSVSIVSSTLAIALSGGVSTLDHINNRFYYTCFFSGNKDSVYTVDLTTNSLLYRKATSVPGTFISQLIEFNDTDTALYCMRQSTVPTNYITKLNPSTGVGTVNPAGAVAGYLSQGISTIDPLNNRFFYVKPSADSLIVLNVSSSAVSGRNKLVLPANYRVMLIEFEKPFSIPTDIARYRQNTFVLGLAPNPAAGKATISASEAMNLATLEFYSLDGRQVKVIKNISGNSFGFSTEDLPANVYIVCLVQDNKVLGRQKLLVKD